MKKKKLVSIAIAVCMIFTVFAPTLAFAGESYSYLSAKKNVVKTYNLKSCDTSKSKYISFTPCKGTVSQDYTTTKWESKKMMYLIQVYSSNGKIYKQFTWNANNIKKTSTFKVTLKKDAKYKVKVTALGCYGVSVPEKYKSVPKLKFTFNNCGLY